MDRYGKDGNVVEVERMFCIMEECGIILDLGMYIVLIVVYGCVKMLERVY